MSTALALMKDFHERGADLTAMLKAWMELSESKGWPQTEEGWRRYLARQADHDSFPRTKVKGATTSGKRMPPPNEFIQFWKDHPDGEMQGTSPMAFFHCERYRNEWIVARRAKAA